jgi:hypothetical protein
MTDFNSQLMAFGNALQPYAQQGIQRSNDELMRKTFAINPTFGTQLYGAKNDQAQVGLQQRQVELAEQEAQRVQAQRTALGQLADQLKRGSNPAAGEMGPVQPLDAEGALLQLATITGDPDALAKYLSKKAGGFDADTPSAIQEYNYWASLTPEQKRDFLSVKRANQVINLGGTQEIRGPDGSVVQQLPVTLKPEDVPANAAAKAGAVANAQNLSDLAIDPQITLANKEAELAAVAEGDVNKKLKQGQDSISIIEEILAPDPKTGLNVLDKATGSGIGSIAAGGKEFFGVSDESTKANAALAVYGGRLLNNVPRMEGPQSDADRRSYEEQAAKIADTSIPAGDKKAALEVIKGLSEKYAALNGAAPSIKEGTIQTNKRTGAKRIMRGGKWQPL